MNFIETYLYMQSFQQINRLSITHESLDGLAAQDLEVMQKFLKNFSLDECQEL
jgi:hypothetical protein